MISKLPAILGFEGDFQPQGAKLLDSDLCAA